MIGTFVSLGTENFIKDRGFQALGKLLFFLDSSTQNPVVILAEGFWESFSRKIMFLSRGPSTACLLAYRRDHSLMGEHRFSCSKP